MAALAELPASPPRGMNGFAPEELPQRGADPAAAAAVSGAGSVSEVPAGLAPPGLAAGAAGSAGAAGAGGPGAGQLCCLREEGERCGRAAGNASFSKRIQKSISQKKLKLDIDKSVSRGLRRLRLPPSLRFLRRCGVGGEACSRARCSHRPAPRSPTSSARQ